MTDRSADRLIQVAAIAGAHGVRGDVRVVSFTAEPEACLTYGPLRDGTGEVLLEAVSVRPGPKHLIVTPRITREKETWDALKGTGLFVPRATLPPTEDADEFYHADLIGLPVYLDGAVLGTLKSIFDFGSGDVLEIAKDDGKGLMLPFTREAVPIVDLANRRIELGAVHAWLDG